MRTTNENKQSQKDINELWGRLINESIAAKISDKCNNSIYSIYTDYESDFMGAYTTILGFKVSGFKNLPQGLVAKTIPISTYRIYKSNGKLPDCVVNTWEHIWETNVKRKYLTDFDVYPPDAFYSDNPIIATYLSI